MTPHRCADRVLLAAGAIAWCACGASFFVRYPDSPAPNQETTEQRQSALRSVDDLVAAHLAEIDQDRVVLRPGDKLIIRMPTNATMDQLDELHTVMAARLPRTDFAVLAADQLGVQRSQDAP